MLLLLIQISTAANIQSVPQSKTTQLSCFNHAMQHFEYKSFRFLGNYKKNRF